MDIAIENIIASVDLATELDLDAVSKALPGAEFNPDRFPGVIYRLADPKIVILLFQNGRMMCTAARSLPDVEAGFETVSRELSEKGLLVIKRKCPNCGEYLLPGESKCPECGAAG
jgi:transcription initiation factor TFIID TATA-box-binding protein